MLDKAVIGALDDGEAEIERIAHRVEPLALRQASAQRRGIEGEACPRRHTVFEPDQREIVGEIDGEQPQPTMPAICHGVFEAIGFGLERVLRDNVIVGDGDPPLAHQEARAD